MLISKEKECRYCYEDNIKNLNKYCNCRGTLEFIHEKCLIEFINKTNNTISQFFKNFILSSPLLCIRIID